jgi:hypothetical protein
MANRLLGGCPVLLLLLLLGGLAGCGHYVNPDIADPGQAKAKLAEDTALCKAEANENVPESYGTQRYEADPTIEAQATRYVANVAQDDRNTDVFSRCMRNRGWRYVK